MKKKNVLLVGANGQMGKVVTELIKQSPDFNLLYIYDRECSKHDAAYNLYDTYTKNIPEDVDVIIDFSTPETTLEILSKALSANTPMVIGTTGFTPDQEKAIENTGNYIPVFKSSNFSYGSNIMIEIAKFAAKLLYPYDVEILDVQHSGQENLPSDTACMLANAIKDAQANNFKDSTQIVINRSTKRKHREIGIVSQRGGGIPGQNTVTFYGPDDCIKIEHSTFDRSMYAKGALTAAKFITKPPKPLHLYTMKDIIQL